MWPLRAQDGAQAPRRPGLQLRSRSPLQQRVATTTLAARAVLRTEDCAAARADSARRPLPARDGVEDVVVASIRGRHERTHRPLGGEAEAIEHLLHRLVPCRPPPPGTPPLQAGGEKRP